VAKTRYGTPCWLGRFPSSRRPEFPRLRGQIAVDVAIVGGGLTGCVAAELFAAAGIDVALFEASRIGQGSTMAGDGLVLHEPGPDVQDLLRLYGLRDVKPIVRACRRASLDFVAAIRRLRLACGLQEADAISYAPAPIDDGRVGREYRARRQAGLDTALLSRAQLFREAGLTGSGIRSRDQAILDPYRACLGFARAAAARGARIFERSPIVRVRPGQRHVEITTERGAATASRVVVATGHPGAGFEPLERHFRLSHSYSVVTAPLAAGVRRTFGPPTTLLREMASPGHRLRWLSGDQVLFSGGDQPRVAGRVRGKAVVQRTGQLMYELSVLYPAMSGIAPEWGWDGVLVRTADGLPYVGPHRHYPRHLFAFGGGPGGAGLSYLAARILLRYHLGAPDGSDELFSFTRARD